MSNRLIGETSPYLLQHANNPVDWYPWGEEALARARSEDRPLLLSIGYAACHWCHVMERESFEDDATARVMNEHFVCIKVDREERPDLDSVYMSAVQTLTGHGGWPMTVFCTPAGTPFYGGTYFPPEDRQGMPSFKRVLEGVSNAWRTQRKDLTSQGKELTKHIEQTTTLRPHDNLLSRDALAGAARAMLEHLDSEWGGFGGAPKFPQPMNLEFLLRMQHIPGALDAVTLTLDRMARGGIFDHVCGGFARYSVDRVWLVPHFEKMLYDNAQLLRLYTRAWQVTHSSLYRETAIATGEYLLREMRHESGGFYSSQDADSEGVEGKFAVWPYDEFIALAGDDVPLAIAAFAVAGKGNWEGTNVLWRPDSDDALAARLNVPVEELRAAVDRVRAKLRLARAHRIPPAIDDKILAGWNGLAIAALAEGGRTFDRPDFVDAAVAAASFVAHSLHGEDGRLHRSWRDGRTSGPGFLDDHAMMAEGYLTLYETTFDPRWWDEAVSLVHAIQELFADERGGFFDTGTDVDPPIVRPKDLFDNAVPSGNSSASDVLLRLAAMDGNADYERAGTAFLRLAYEAMTHSPLGFGHALCALDRALARAQEVAIVGDLDSPDTRALITAARTGYRPNRVIAAGKPGPSLLRDRPARDGHATAYVCENFACKEPVTTPEALREQLFL